MICIGGEPNDQLPRGGVQAPPRRSIHETAFLRRRHVSPSRVTRCRHWQSAATRPRLGNWNGRVRCAPPHGKRPRWARIAGCTCTRVKCCRCPRTDRRRRTSHPTCAPQMVLCHTPIASMVHIVVQDAAASVLIVSLLKPVLYAETRENAWSRAKKVLQVWISGEQPRRTCPRVLQALRLRVQEFRTNADDQASASNGVEGFRCYITKANQSIAFQPFPPDQHQRLRQNLIRQTAKYGIGAGKLFEEIFSKSPGKTLRTFLRRHHQRALEQFDLLPGHEA